MSDSGVEWEVVDKIPETPSSNTFVFSPCEKAEFSVGQFVTVGTTITRPSQDGGTEEDWAERAYSIASSPARDLVEICIKTEKPYGYVTPTLKKADGFAAYFNEQVRKGDRVKVRLEKRKDHFLYKVASGLEKDIAYWSGANGVESARGLIQWMEDRPDLGIRLLLFYSNPHLYLSETDRRINVIYYDWLIEKAKSIPNLKVVLTFTRDSQIPVSDHPHVIYRRGRFFTAEDGTPEKTLTKYRGTADGVFNPICGSSGFVTGVVAGPDGGLVRRKGMIQNLAEIEGVGTEKMDREQFYLDHAHG
ncbi:MAG: hypothetical protein KGI33_05370 [Thaumarchaeota archaeon]|nr:hypothetical protein [Nitrososphaerota archaeon]